MVAEKTIRQVQDAWDGRSALVCARLYLRDGKRYLRQGACVEGIAALYDSLIFAMRYYVSRHQVFTGFTSNLEVADATSLFYALVRAGVFDDPLVFNRLSLLVERALWQHSYPSDTTSILAEVERLLRKLDVMPDRARPN